MTLQSSSSCARQMRSLRGPVRSPIFTEHYVGGLHKLHRTEVDVLSSTFTRQLHTCTRNHFQATTSGSTLCPYHSHFPTPLLEGYQSWTDLTRHHTTGHSVLTRARGCHWHRPEQRRCRSEDLGRDLWPGVPPVIAFEETPLRRADRNA